MNGDSPVSWLMFFTLAATVFVIAGSFIFFLRSRNSREIAAETLGGDNSRVGATPNGAAPELVGFSVIAVALLALLATGVSSRNSNTTTAQIQPAPSTGALKSTPSAAAPPAGTTTGTAQPVGSANEPKKYQPANPVPDTRSAPTSSDTGVGPENGTTGQPK